MNRQHPHQAPEANPAYLPVELEGLRSSIVDRRLRDERGHFASKETMRILDEHLEAMKATPSGNGEKDVPYHKKLRKSEGERKLDARLRDQGIDPDSVIPLDESSRTSRLLGWDTDKKKESSQTEAHKLRMGGQTSAEIRNRILHSEGAQKAFAEGGEEAYQAYIAEQFDKNSLALQFEEVKMGTSMFALESGEADGAADAGRQPSAKELLTSVDLSKVEAVFEKARDEYVRLITERRRISTFSRKFSKGKLAEARANYEKAQVVYGAEALKALREKGLSEETLKEFALTTAIEQAADLEDFICNRSIEVSQNTRGAKFYQWWARQGGADKFLKGFIQKGVVIGVPAAAIGTMGSILMAPLVGASVAAGSAAVVTTRIARGLAAVKIRKEADAPKVAKKQSMTAYDEHLRVINEAYRSDRGLKPELVTDTVESQTSLQVNRNRRRLVGSVAGVFVLGAAAGEVTDRLPGWVEKIQEYRNGVPAIDVEPEPSPDEIKELAPDTPDRADQRIRAQEERGAPTPREPEPEKVEPTEPESTPTPTPEPETEMSVEELESLLPEDFTIEYANGYTHEIMDSAELIGRPISVERAYEIHLRMVEEFGRDYINIKGIKNDVYTTISGDHRLSAPGFAVWDGEMVVRRLRELIEK
jgi:hypothetical protein